MRPEVRQFAKLIGMVTGATLVAAAYPVIKFFDETTFFSVLVGSVFGLAIVLFAFFLNNWAFDKDSSTFYRAVLGGMFARFVFILLSLFLVWKFTSLNVIAFSLALFALYFIFQVVEIRYIQLQHSKKNKSQC